MCDIRSYDILAIEFSQPCEITYQPDAIIRSIEILLTRARAITSSHHKDRLAQLARLLRRFNPQRKEWHRRKERVR